MSFGWTADEVDKGSLELALLRSLMLIYFHAHLSLIVPHPLAPIRDQSAHATMEGDGSVWLRLLISLMPGTVKPTLGINFL